MRGCVGEFQLIDNQRPDACQCLLITRRTRPTASSTFHSQEAHSAIASSLAPPPPATHEQPACRISICLCLVFFSNGLRGAGLLHAAVRASPVFPHRGHLWWLANAEHIGRGHTCKPAGYTPHALFDFLQLLRRIHKGLDTLKELAQLISRTAIVFRRQLQGRHFLRDSMHFAGGIHLEFEDCCDFFWGLGQNGTDIHL